MSVNTTYSPLTDTLSTVNGHPFASTVYAPPAGFESGSRSSLYVSVSVPPITSALWNTGGIVSSLSTLSSVRSAASFPEVSWIGFVFGAV